MIWNDSQGGMSKGSHWWLRREAAIELANMMDDGSSKPSSGVAVLEAGEFLLGDNGKPEKSRGNLRAALQKLGVKLWYDEFAKRPIVAGLRGHGPQLDDAGLRALHDLLNEQYGLAFGRETLVRYLLTVAEKDKRHPVREYLDGLRWDGVPRVDAWLSTYLGVEPSSYAREVGRCFLLGAVARVRSPGCKFDEMLILECSSHSWLKYLSRLVLLLVGCDDWIAYKTATSRSDRTFTKSMFGKWIAVDTGLSELKRGDARTLHIRLSSSHDRFRVRRSMEDYPRQCMFMGTTCEERYLKKSNRRFWPVRIGNPLFSKLDADRPQLWAEAAHRQASGEPTYMHESLWAVAAVEQDRRTLLR